MSRTVQPLRVLTLSERLRDFSEAHRETRGDVFLVKVIKRGRTVEERWDTSYGIRCRLFNYITRHLDAGFDIRVHDGSDRLCKLILTTETEG